MYYYCKYGDQIQVGFLTLYLFIVLSNEGFWTNFNLGDIGVLIQDMNVIVRWDAIDTLLIMRARAPTIAHHSSCIQIIN